MVASPIQNILVTEPVLGRFQASFPITQPFVPAPETVAELTSDKVFAPVVIFPAVKVSPLLMVGLLFSVTPLALLMVRLFKAVTLLGMLIPVELPPKTRLEDEVVDKLAGVPAIVGPFSVKVFPPTEKVPLVSVSVPLIVVVPASVMVPEPEMVRLL